MAVENGVPIQQGGVWVGGLNFDDLTPGAGLPAGLTPFGALAVDGIFEVVTPPKFVTVPDGLTQALSVTPGTNNENGGLGIDAFDAVWSGYGEIVVCAGLPGDDGKFTLGPAVGMGGVVQGTLKGEYAGFRQGNAVAIELATYEIINGGLGTVYGAGNVPGMENQGTGTYKWCRMRLDDAGGGNTQIRAQGWDGNFADDPGGYLRDNTAVLDLIGALGVIIRGMDSVPPDNEYELLFFSFTEDPDIAAAPSPSEVVDSLGPNLTITEVQGTWATGEIDTVTPTPVPEPADFRTLAFADSPWDWIDGDFQIFANPAGGVLQINLPDAAAYIATGNFNPVHVKNIGAPGLDINTEYVQVFGINGNTIDGFTDVINRLQQTNHTFVTDGLNWYLQ